jgi:hypothetical protein
MKLDTESGRNDAHKSEDQRFQNSNAAPPESFPGQRGALFGATWLKA